MFVLNTNFGEADLTRVFNAVASQFGSLERDYQADNILDLWAQVEAQNEDFSRDAWASEGFVSRNKLSFIIITPGGVTIRVYKNEVSINFGRDSQSLSKTIVNAIAFTMADVSMYNENGEVQPSISYNKAIAD